MKALAYVHKRRVAHGSLGSVAAVLSHVNDCNASQLVVKLDHFCLANAEKLP
jgi:hypothetical protein